MKGLALAERFFRIHGFPMIENQFAAHAHLIAAGLVGPGSECFGFDDHLSRDHDWGPGFCLWLDKTDFEYFGCKLQSAYERLPKRFMGFGPRRCSPGEEHRVGVVGIQEFYQIYTGFDHPPNHVEEWLRIPEEALAVCTNGRIFQDPSGNFSSWRQKLLQYYPEDVRIYKIARCCVRAAQSGQYNFKRSFERREWFALRYAEIQFCDDALSLTFLLNKSYAPFYKWRHRAVRDLSGLGQTIYDDIAALMTCSDNVQKTRIIDQICNELVKEMKQQKLTDSGSDFLLDHVQSMKDKLDNPNLRKRFSMVS
jgi:hypothetical protein